jgi:hypothetical protein
VWRTNIDWRDRPGSDSLFTWKPSAREVRSFENLGDRDPEPSAGPDVGRTRRNEIADDGSGRADLGKYGAI